MPIAAFVTTNANMLGFVALGLCRKCDLLNTTLLGKYLGQAKKMHVLYISLSAFHHLRKGIHFRCNISRKLHR